MTSCPKVNAIGGEINAKIDFIHDTDHGVRICNAEDPENQGVSNREPFFPGTSHYDT